MQSSTERESTLSDPSSYRIKNYLSVAHCYKCQGLGHVGKYCKKDTNVRGRCAHQGHDIKDCPNKNNNPVCASCQSCKKDANHKTGDKLCPICMSVIQKVIDQTAYEF